MNADGGLRETRPSAYRKLELAGGCYPHRGSRQSSTACLHQRSDKLRFEPPDPGSPVWLVHPCSSVVSCFFAFLRQLVNPGTRKCDQLAELVHFSVNVPGECFRRVRHSERPDALVNLLDLWQVDDPVEFRVEPVDRRTLHAARTEDAAVKDELETLEAGLL